MSFYNVLSITANSWNIIKRMFARSVFLVILTALGLAAADLLVDSGMGDRFALVRRFPDFIPLMVAAAKFTFIEMSIFWIRFGTQPRNDNQNAAELATGSATGSAIVYLTNMLQWGIRIAVFLFLAYGS